MFYLLSLLTTILFVPSIIFAQGYEPIVGIPGIANPNSEFGEYINTLYALSIAVAGLLAVVKLVIAGVKYMMTDIVTSKGEAKKDIQGALLGLLVVLAAVLILTIINRDITEADIQMTPAAEIPRPPEPPGSGEYVANIEPGYIWIPLDSRVEQLNKFREDCVAPSMIIQDIVTNQLRCTTITDTVANEIRGYLSGLSDAEITILVAQYQNDINNWVISDAAVLADIQTELGGVAQIYYAVDLSTYPVGNVSQFDGVCRAIARANGDPESLNIQTNYDYGTNHAVCFRIS